MATEVLQLGIDSTGAVTGARQFERATTSVQQGATKADAATKRMEGSFDKLRRQVLLAERALGALGITIGAGALVRSIARATADMDTLRRSLDAVTGSSAETARQLKELREVAKLPGLGFKEAIQGAVNLEVVGFNAKETTRILKDFGNAVALTGGGKNELDRVIFQFTQMASLGKVTSQDLKPIIQTAPAVAKAMLQVFGTISPDKIAAMGLTFEQFTEKLLGGMEKLPAATGGVRNSFENLSDATFQASAAFGSHFAPAVASILDPLSKSLLKLADNDRAMRDLTAGISALGKALLVGGVVAGLVKLAAALRDVELATVALQALRGPTGWLVIGVAALATYLYKQGGAARDAASAINDYANSLSNLSRQGLLNQQAGLNLSASYLQSQIAAAPKTVQKTYSMGDAVQITDVPNPALPRMQGQLDMVIRQSVAVANALSAMAPAKAGGGGPTTSDADTITKAVNAAFDRFAAKLGSAMGQIGLRPANNEDFLAARQANPFDVKYKPVASIFLPVQRTVDVPAVPALDVPTRFDSLRASAAKFGGGVKDAATKLAAQFGPLALAAAALKPVFDGLREALGPAITAVAAPLKIVGQLLGGVLAPVLNLVAPPLKLIAKVASYVVEGLGYIVLAAGKAAGALSFGLAGKGLRRTGDEIIAGARTARSALNGLGDAADKLSASLSTDLPRAINLALYRARVGGGSVGGPVGGVPASGGGIGGGYHPPAYTPGNHPAPAPSGGVTVSIGQYHSAANETPEDAARKMAKGAQILASQGVKLYAPALVTAA